ncbi:MAG: GNAT family N-acetyltransferase [Lachnospiraceae bacterium]|nr:GNAT family N-acetyltransferase [Lachnospiraceae bacterium]
MKRLHIYIEKEEVLQRLQGCLCDLECAGVDVCIHSLSAEQLSGFSEKQSLIDLGLLDWKESLYLTDIPQFATMLAHGDYPVLAYVHEENRNESFAFVKYVIEGFEDVEAEYFYRTWQRLVGLPWHILDTKRCSIRETVVEDLEAFYEIYKEPSVTEYMESLFADRQEERAYIETYAEVVYGFYGFGMWTVVLRETGEVIGRAGISMREGFEEPELGFVIGVPWQGKGIAMEVCQGILQYAREELGFDKVQAFVQPGNEKSEALLKKLGFLYDKKVNLPEGEHLLYFLKQ